MTNSPRKSDLLSIGHPHMYLSAIIKCITIFPNFIFIFLIVFIDLYLTIFNGGNLKIRPQVTG